MPSPTTNIRETKSCADPQFAHDVTDYTMQKYYRPGETDASPITGFCIPTTPQIRLTNSPTGGIVGRYLVKRSRHASFSYSTLTSSEGSSVSDSPSLLQEADHEPSFSMQQHLLGSQEALVNLQLSSQLQSPARLGNTGDVLSPTQVSVHFPRKLVFLREGLTRPQQPLIQQFDTGNERVRKQCQQPVQPLYAKSGNITPASNLVAGHFSPESVLTHAVTRKKPTSSGSGLSTTPHKPLDPADRKFLFKTLDQQLKASNNASLMTRLVPVHQGRPGEHILRMNEQTGELYACIPSNPFAPKSTVGQQEYSLPSYDSYIQEKANGGRRAKEPYPAAGQSSLNTCNHCMTPTKVLNNDSLCPFHAYYLVTGRFLGYYEFCALVEMEKHGLSVSSGWWTIKDMVQFVDALAERVHKWRFIEESSAVPKGSWISKASPFGAIGTQVPQRARGKTAFQFGAEQTMAMAASRHTSRHIDQATMASQLEQLFRETGRVISA